MENKLCRTCGNFNGDFVDIFKTEGLGEKIETCLPIIVSQHCLLPDTVCMECYRNVLDYYSFMKKCLQNIIILEAQYNIQLSCLKSKRKHDRSTTTLGVGPGPGPVALVQWPLSKNDVDGEDIGYYKDKFRKFDVKLAGFEKSLQELDDLKPKIVDYPCSSSDEDSTNINNKRYFDDKENDLIREIAERKSLKRKSESVLCNRPKMFKMDTNRRKKRPPMKVKCKEICDLQKIYDEIEVPSTMAIDQQQQQHNASSMVQKALPQICLLCDMQFDGPSLLAEHVYETHGIDMAQIVSNEPILEKKKKMIPNLVKIADLKAKRESEESMEVVENREEPPTLEPSYVCPLCPATLTNRSDLFQHLRQKHATKSHMICGLCLYMADSYLNLTDHIEICLLSHPISNPYICKVCKYNDDNHKAIENHVLVHDFLISFCKKENRIFDPADYIETNPDSENHKVYNCTECELNLSSFRDFTAHRRSEHSIFHCDLCNKFYGRNSHLWKHVNRLHKGHPSITCQFCYKTSASKYHLAQHFNKIHTSKTPKLKNGDIVEEEDFLNKKFEAFDFQSVRQSFMRQELEKNEQQQSAKVMTSTAQQPLHLVQHHHPHHHQHRHNQHDLTLSMIDEGVEVPKEIDTSSNLYTNIITNYTPPQNNGEFKCPKCSKGFHKKTLLKKHKKNCRPRLQKDLLTRCKSCSRIFKDRQSLAKHLVNYHSEYACEICKEKVQSKCEIVSHIRFSHPDCHLFCQDCGNVLRKSEDLKAHSEDHQNSFVCQFCADLLPSKIKLKMHILSLHRKILSLSCGICLKLFETQHVLRDHVRLVHKDVLTPLTSCTVCGKNYGSKWKTFDHLNKSHGRIFKACKACLEVFDTDRDLEVHYESAHGASGKDKSTVASTAGAVKKDAMTAAAAIKKEADDSGDDKSSYSEESPYEPEESVKISLLEKRLTAVPEKNSHQQQQQQQQKKKVSTATAVSAAKKVKIETDFTPDQNGGNSSKRTVYVNSNDPSFCEICHKTWPAKKHLWQHYIRCHKLVAATVCGICLKTNDNYEMLQAHLQDTHPTLLHGQGFGSNFICRICGRYHNARSKLKLHMAIHENFDWSLLENSYLKTTDAQEEDIEEEDDDINYESLIEQVECSSENDNEEENEETSSSSESDESETEGLKMEIESEEEEEEDGEEDGEEDSSSRSGDVVKSEDNSESEEEEDEDEDFDYSNDGKNMKYARHQDVVDSAVKSISYDDYDYEDQDDQDPEYSDSAQENLNSHEIQSAVDSIL